MRYDIIKFDELINEAQPAQAPQQAAKKPGWAQRAGQIYGQAKNKINNFYQNAKASHDAYNAKHGIGNVGNTHVPKTGIKSQDAQRILGAYNTHTTYIKPSLEKIIDLGEKVAQTSRNIQLQNSTVQLEKSIENFNNVFKRTLETIAKSGNQGQAQKPQQRTRNLFS